MKNGGKNKSVAFIILVNVYTILVSLYFTVCVLPWYIHGKYLVPTGK